MRNISCSIIILLTLFFSQALQARTWIDHWTQTYLSEDEIKLDSRADLDVTFTMSAVTEYIWRGFDMFDDRGALQPSINVDLYDTGFNTFVWSAIPVKEEIGNKTEMRYGLGYTNWFWDDSPFLTKYTINWIYYDFIELPSRQRDAQELGVQFSWPNAYVFGDNRIVPSYYAGKMWPAKGKAVNHDQGGWIHILGLDCQFQLFGQAAEKQIFALTSELVYNDGILGADHDWSDAVFGVETTLREGPVKVKPEFKYQVSLDESVNDEDELWGGISVSYQF